MSGNSTQRLRDYKRDANFVSEQYAREGKLVELYKQIAAITNNASEKLRAQQFIEYHSQKQKEWLNKVPLLFNRVS